MTLKVIFWIIAGILFYTYAGYAVLLFILLKLKGIFSVKPAVPSCDDFEPEVCLFVTAYNEKDYADQKVRNSFSLNYPRSKVQYLWITDGSDDGTPRVLRKYPELEVYHEPERKGKIHAMNRGMKFVRAPIVIFSDTNTRLGVDSVREIVAKFRDRQVGCVAGEKRIVEQDADTAAGAGEGIYWKYESWVKKMDGEFNSAVGAVGELFAIRTELYDEVENDTLLDDFIISLRIASKGYRIAYSPRAYAEETPSVNTREELKRKIRIAAGGIQTIFRLKGLLNPFRHGWLSWQYFSHKVLRWTVSPLSFFILFFINTGIVMSGGSESFYLIVLCLQVLFYLFALAGWYLENHKTRMKFFFIPFYFVFINYASVRGLIRYIRGKQSVKWEKSARV